MVNIACSDNDHILAEVVSVSEVQNHITVDLINVIWITENRLAHHMLSEDVVVHVLH
jgi:hypothetical protein